MPRVFSLAGCDKWGDEKENAYQTLKDMLCDSPILALPEGPNDLVVYYDSSNQGFGCVLMQRNKVIEYASRQLKMHKKNYTTHDLELGQVVFALKMWRHYLYRTKSVIYTDHESKANVVADALSMKEWMKPRIVLAYGNLRTLIIDEAHVTKYFAHPGADKMYYDLRYLYWWPEMKKDIAIRRFQSGTIREDYKMERFARLYINEIVARHSVPVSIISDHDSQFTSRFWQSIQKALGTQLDLSTDYHPHTNGQIKFSYDNSYYSSVKCGPFEALYGSKCRMPIAWVEVGESKLIGLGIVHETTDKIMQIKERLKATRDHQKSYADNRRKPLEFNVGNKVLLKVSPWKGVVRFGKRSNLSPTYVGPFEIVERVSPIAYRLRILQELIGIHDTFHVPNLKECLTYVILHVPLEEIKIDNGLRFVEEPIEIMDCEVKKLKQSRIPIVKVHCNSQRGPEFSWEREYEMKRKYLQMFVSAMA
ncbi:putative reverse transcriptase domain-containing protein [Tanacetum coccineum]|uniref:Reverse transcriptase domain-containing protein n=1 Tax=Tanacetum coccineum TaxID=301880 RepID=A0ABQ5J3X5_9ASTR